ncbi:hypothetical protein [Wenxinia marina]|uniref:Uncharacterized protein n=1 Tax=Wenxinia marina DSM 24838 TaxID=1123501 RepID=A0A0D0Q8P7_9RHOB|nr:hypothetical protein [Wenxinia marina]KIQ70764.1 hypothetical protein Wenmar_00648 [Wenxinia marina DSM 24838]GGL80322.1 hypothetical protein GCM10011392_38650 [Wenxinia marina]
MNAPRSFSALAKREHVRASRMLGFALTTHDFDGWDAFALVCAARLTASERAAMAWASLRSLDPDDAMAVVMTALPAAGAPMPPWTDPLEDAEWWTSRASPDELRAYLAAIFNALPRMDREDFLAFAQGRDAA